MESEETWNSQGHAEQKKQSRRHRNSRFQIIPQSYGNKNSMVIIPKQNVDNGPEQKIQNQPHEPPLVFMSGAKIISLKVDSYLLSCTKIKFKWIKDLDMKTKTLKLLKDNIGKIFEAIGIGKDFLIITLIAKKIKPRINKWNFIKLQSFFTGKKTINRVKIIANYCSDRRLTSKLCKELSKLIPQTSDSIKNKQMN